MGYPLPELPLISYVMDSPRAMAIVPRQGFGAATEDPAATHAAAMDNLNARAFEWTDELDDDGNVESLRFIDEFAAETLLCPTRLQAAHKRLGDDVLLVAAPIRDLIRAQAGISLDHLNDPTEPIKRLMAWARHVYEEATDTGTHKPVSPYVFIVQAGLISGVSFPQEGPNITTPPRDAE